jgi:hypothetical protein
MNNNNFSFYALIFYIFLLFFVAGVALFLVYVADDYHTQTFEVSAVKTDYSDCV